MVRTITVFFATASLDCRANLNVMADDQSPNDKIKIKMLTLIKIIAEYFTENEKQGIYS
ncbi:hypothetical protein PJ912_16820 [Pectobacterium colocasium]|uniref:hypothetical protein n=1 Tax=Pectobacterium colocasium TaxID=2878098 RepID=UPI0027A115D5|nr:hypothetical protein PJ912_16820 [Pectobacterium colocasium]